MSEQEYEKVGDRHRNDQAMSILLLVMFSLHQLLIV
jgi:hypothetical protein